MKTVNFNRKSTPSVVKDKYGWLHILDEDKVYSSINTILENYISSTFTPELIEQLVNEVNDFLLSTSFKATFVNITTSDDESTNSLRFILVGSDIPKGVHYSLLHKKLGVEYWGGIQNKKSYPISDKEEAIQEKSKSNNSLRKEYLAEVEEGLMTSLIVQAINIINGSYNIKAETNIANSLIHFTIELS